MGMGYGWGLNIYMKRIIASSAHFLKKLREVKWAENYTVRFFNQSIAVDDVEIECECQKGPDEQMSYDAYTTLIRLLAIVSDRPVVVGFSGGYVYIKEMML